MVALRTFGLREGGSAVRMMSTSRARDSGATCGEVAPIANAAMTTAISGSGLKTTQAVNARATQVRQPAPSATERGPQRAAAAAASEDEGERPDDDQGEGHAGDESDREIATADDREQGRFAASGCGGASAVVCHTNPVSPPDSAGDRAAVVTWIKSLGRCTALFG